MNFPVYVLFLLLEKTIPLFPLGLVQRTAKLKALFFYYFIPVRKRVAYKYIKLAFPEKSDAEVKTIIKGAYVNVVTAIFEFFWMRKMKMDELTNLVKPEGLRLITEKMKQGKGLVIISAHFGNWELTAHGGARIAGVPFNVIVKEQTNKLVDKRINRIRESAGNKMIGMTAAVKEVLGLLRNNNAVALLGDQSAPKENSVTVKFFVNDVPAFEGAARFAIKTRSPAVFGVSVRRKDGTYDIILNEIDINKYEQYTEDNIKRFTQEHTDILAEHIKAHPDHWLWFHKKFKHMMEY